MSVTVTVEIPDKWVHQLDQLSEKEKIAREEVVIRMIEAALEESLRRRVHEIVEEYKALPARSGSEDFSPEDLYDDLGLPK